MSDQRDSPGRVAPSASESAGTELAAEIPPDAEPSADADWIGRVLDGRYRIESKLGEGGMGAVFVARHLKLQKPVALKVVRAELAGNGEVAIRFAREAMATAQFEHPHVASAIDYGGLPEGGAYFVMQLVRGRSLRDRLQQGAMPWRNACNIVAQVADALSAARATGIVHRDLKPENILVETREDGSELAKVLDFGIAHVAPSTQPAPAGAMPQRELTRVGTVMGTPGYMAPEQAVGDRVDHRADLYALGVVLWECVAGRELWDGPDITSIITRQVSEQPPPLRAVAPDANVPAELDACVAQLLARHPDERPEHAGEVRDLLQRLAQQPDNAAAGAQVAQRVSQVADQVGELARGGRASARQLHQAFRAQPPRRQAIQLGVAAAGLLALALLMPGEAAPPGQPAKTAPPTGVVETVVDAVEQAQKAVQPKVDAILTPGIPLELADHVSEMLDGDRRGDRRDAAVVVLAYEPREAVATYLVAIAELEAARSCRARRDAIAAIVELDDERTVPVLERWRSTPKTGCGFLKLQDCNACIRRPLREALAAMSADAQP